MRRVELTTAQWLEACVGLHCQGARFSRYVMHDEELGLGSLTEPDLARLRRILAALEALENAERVGPVSHVE